MIRVIGYRNRLPREPEESLSLEIFKTYLDTFLCLLITGQDFQKDVTPDLVTEIEIVEILSSDSIQL